MISILERSDDTRQQRAPQVRVGQKTIYTLNVDGYAREITDLTYPLIQKLAEKIGADFHVIYERRWPDAPVTYEKLQIFYLARERGDEWCWYVDSDALIHPDIPDITALIDKGTVIHNGADIAGNRWVLDDYFRRDGRWISSCNWFTVASHWCLDLWRPLEDLSIEEAIANIRPTVAELSRFDYERDESGKPIQEPDGAFRMVQKQVITAEHLLDDYVLSRNIAKHGLHFKTFSQLQREIGDPGSYTWHAYWLTTEQKVKAMKNILRMWMV